MLGHSVSPSDAEVDAAFANECGYVCCGQEDEGKRQVLDEGYIEAVVAVELDVAAGEEIEAGLI